ncbi:MAG: hypothetical protein Udaeo2_19270 [Candidatus Udaeobacter sp.]|jgi:hypothetical protein|nr:MAG: hypothetical protein Udaeo2_19270 [Candidatus Udaeobacter sp.]
MVLGSASELDCINAVQLTDCDVIAPSQSTSGAKGSAADQEPLAPPAISLSKPSNRSPKGGDALGAGSDYLDSIPPVCVDANSPKTNPQHEGGLNGINQIQDLN